MIRRGRTSVHPLAPLGAALGTQIDSVDPAGSLRSRGGGLFARALIAFVVASAVVALRSEGELR